MTFGNPWLLLSLLILPVAVALYVLAQSRRMRYALRFTNLEVLAQVAGRRRAWRRYVPPALFLTALACLCVALARPHTKTLIPVDKATIILVIDASRSMEATDVKPTRLAAAERAAKAFLDKVPKRARVGLVVFSGEAQVAAPPTTDRSLVRESIDEIGAFSGYGGTAIGDAVARAVELGIQAVGVGNRSLASVSAAPSPAGPTRGLVSILFLSDGRQNRGILQPLEGAARAKAAGIPVYTVALGTRSAPLADPFGGPPQQPPGFGGGAFGNQFNLAPDPATLRAIANATGGQFFAARNAKSLNAAYNGLGSRLGRKPGKTEITYGFVAAAAALLVAAGLLSAFWSPRLP
jgi:Ca-activated chloride channel family protein